MEKEENVLIDDFTINKDSKVEQKIDEESKNYKVDRKSVV